MMSQKKITVFLVFIMMFSGFLALQIGWDHFHLKANEAPADNKFHKQMESQFQALNFVNIEGKSIILKNEKAPVVVLNFWASWCTPCLDEFPSLVEFQHKFPGQVRVIGINGDTENAQREIGKVRRKYKLNFDIVLDPDSKISSLFDVQTYPVSLVFSKGKLIYVSKKRHDFMKQEFIELIENSLKAK
jgi:thiol-disulfide isomerase/thioredoxin